jgi:LCP family protein required for cell wall assembly
MSVHLTDLELFNFIEGGSGAARSPELVHHLQTCAACQARQTQYAQAADQLADTLARMANAAPFAPAQSWTRLAPRLQQARRSERVSQVLRPAAFALMTLLFVFGMIRLVAWMRPQPVIEPSATLLPAIAPTNRPIATTLAAPTPKPQAGRITILVAGMDRRPGEAGPGLTDSLMLFSLDRAQHTAVVFSIPRDLWVDIPGHGPGRINSAYALGENSRPGSGATLLKQTASAALGVRVDHVVRVEFSAVVTLIDAIGGVDIDVPSVINDPLFPDSGHGYDPLFIPAGRQHMDGTLALKYMRTRHSNNDFARSARQQQVVAAARQKIAQPSTWPDFVRRVPDLVAQLKSALATDLSLADMLDLAGQARDVPDGSLRTAVLDGRYVVDYVTPDGAQVLLPLKDRVSAFVGDLFATGQTPATPEAEMARIRVLNGTSQTGLAARTADWLRQRGFNVVSAENADRFTYEKTLLMDHAGRPATVKALADLFKVESGSLVYRPEPAAPSEIDLVLGADFALPAQ